MNRLLADRLKKKNLINYKTDIIVHDNIETIQKLIEGYSIARYGDGEFFMMIDKDMLYETQNTSLKNRLVEVLTQNDNPKLLLGIPKMYFHHDEEASGTMRGKFLVHHWNDRVRKYVHDNMHLFNRSEYYSSFFTQLYAYPPDYIYQIIPLVKKIWNSKNVVLFMNQKIWDACQEVIKKLFDNSTNVIHELIPEKGAWLIYDDILESIKKYDVDHLMLVCCGATATVLAYDASKLGYQTIDFGQLIEGLHLKYAML